MNPKLKQYQAKDAIRVLEAKNAKHDKKNNLSILHKSPGGMSKGGRKQKASARTVEAKAGDGTKPGKK